MRRKVMLVVVLVAASLAVAVAPAGANNKPTTAPRISFAAPPDALRANAPFYIEQGHGCLLSDTACMTREITGRSPSCCTSTASASRRHPTSTLTRRTRSSASSG
jgi:hypothetical protein